MLCTCWGAAFALPPCPAVGYYHLCTGKESWPNGNRYVGDYKNNKKHGQGVYTAANGDSYSGEFKDGTYNGMGTYRFANGSIYSGEFKDGRRAGQGVFTRADGSTVLGEWNNDLAQGRVMEFAGDATLLRSGLYDKGRMVSPQVLTLDMFARLGQNPVVQAILGAQAQRQAAEAAEAARVAAAQAEKLAQQRALAEAQQQAEAEAARLAAEAAEKRAAEEARRVEEARRAEEARQEQERQEQERKAEEERQAQQERQAEQARLAQAAADLAAAEQAQAQAQAERQRQADAARGRTPDDERRPKGPDGTPRNGPLYKREFGTPKPKAQENFTDPESRIMKRAGGGFDYSYNAHAAVDETAHIIVVAELTNNGADSTRLPSLLEGVKQTAGQSPRQVLADAGFRSEAVFEVLREHPSELVVALCREGKKQRAIDAQKRPHTAAMARKFETEQTKQDYRRRKWISEPPNGWVKNVLGFRQFSLRGLAKARAEWRLVCAALNLRRMAVLMPA